MGPTEATLRRALLRATGDAPASLRVRAEPLRGGLDSPSVARLAVYYAAADGRARQARFVAKELVAGSERELLAYEVVARPHAGSFAPELFATERREDGGMTLVLEAIPRASAWPWSDEGHSLAVLRRAAELHAATGPGTEAHARLRGWDFEGELERAAVSTVELAERLSRRPDLAFVLRALPALRRTARSVGALRRALLGAGPYGPAVLHGDLHAGNALVRRSGAGRAADVVLVDWGRARLGSPFEDLSSWLHALGTWEPVARRRHDSWVRAYLAARGSSERIGPEIREAIWLGGASNALAGALHYHLYVAAGEGRPSARRASLRAAYDWCRIVRRADACVSEGGARGRRSGRPAASPPRTRAPSSTCSPGGSSPSAREGLLGPSP